MLGATETLQPAPSSEAFQETPRDADHAPLYRPRADARFPNHLATHRQNDE